MKLEEAAVELEMNLEETLDRMVGKRELLIRLLRYFVQEQNLKEIAKAKECAEYEKMERLLHSMKGSALSLGCVRMAEVCHELVMMLRSNKSEEYDALFEAVEREFYRTKEIVDGLDR